MSRLSAALLALSLCGCSAFLGSDDDPAFVTILPGTANFGKVVASVESAPVVFQVVGLEDTAPLAVELDHEAFHVVFDGCRDVELLRGQTCEIAVSFTPDVSGHQVGSLVVGNNIADLAGEGLEPGDLAVSPPMYEFPDTVPGDSASAMFQVVNQGEAAIAVTAIESSEAAFGVGQSDCTEEVIEPDGACMIEVRFTPDGPGSVVGSLSIAGSGDAGPVETSISLAGRGVTPQHNLRVTVNGEGNVESMPPGIDCDGDRANPAVICNASFDDGVTVILDAKVAVVWTGDCGNGDLDTDPTTCTLLMDRDRVVVATFPIVALD